MWNPVTFRLLFVSCCLHVSGTAEVVTLTDQTFEHQTQASTGATTGSWLLLFQAPECKSCQTLKPILEVLSSELSDHHGIVIGALDVKENPTTATRFEMETVPTLLYLHKGAMYRYSAAALVHMTALVHASSLQDDLTNFVLQDYQKETALPIPEPVSWIQQIVKVVSNVFKQDNQNFLFYHKLLFAIAVVGMVLMLIATSLVLLVTLAKSSKKQKTKSS
jgi:thiol-disulfide isomerase/thioredoxin